MIDLQVCRARLKLSVEHRILFSVFWGGPEPYWMEQIDGRLIACFYVNSGGLM